MDPAEAIARGWDAAVDGYEEYFVPRFAPWVGTAVDALGSLPDGPLLVPCCGTFPELPLLAERWPDREIVGIDLSAGMVRRALERAASWPYAGVVQGDASTLDQRWSGACAGVVSVFGLQQLPDPGSAIRNWSAALRPGGRLAVVFWPEVTETDGPFALARQVVGRHVRRESADWEGRLTTAAEAGGLTVERDALVAFPMTHEGPAEFWDAMSSSGPLAALALARGPDLMTRLRDEFLAAAPAGEWTHQPTARLVTGTRAAGAVSSGA